MTGQHTHYLQTLSLYPNYHRTGTCNQTEKTYHGNMTLKHATKAN